MSSIELPTSRPLVRADRMVLATFALTLFTSAFLLFLIQPMFTKMVLPLLGGSPAVWSLALVFFQGILLLGYAYAHALVGRFDVKFAALMHLAVLATALVSLPIAIPAAWQDVPADGQGLWVIGLFAASVGLPFFAVSANAPLLQHWFSKTSHPQRHDPYFLYGASNCGSFAALLLYPFVIEPLLPLGSQTMFWSIVYGLLAALIAASGYIAWKHGMGTITAAQSPVTPVKAPALRDRLIWTGLAFVPSGLLVAVSSYISTDLVAAPFLWVVPLALFLLTFVVAFQQRPWLSHRSMLFVHSLVVAPLAVFLFAPATWAWLIGGHLFAFFITTMVCHGELVRRRPDARYLTEFYLTMSFGGVLGGLFASLIAPQVFSSIFEYPILMLAAFLCRSDVWTAIMGKSRREAAAFALAPAAVLATHVLTGEAGLSLAIWATLLAFVLLVALYARPLAQAGVLSAALILVLTLGVNQNAVARIRSFFGVNTVYAMDAGRYHALAHGTTMHGAQQWLDASGNRIEGKPQPLSYFYEGGPYDATVKLFRQAHGPLEHVAVVGLGAGVLACYSAPGENWRFYEIDPEVVRIAMSPDYFTYMSECAPGADVVMGDGRLTVNKEAAGSLDLIILDAFSSDSVPAHLMTVEAMKMYFSKLKPGGAIIFNISNRFMDLRSVVHSVARENGAVAYFNRLNDGLWRVDRTQYKIAPLVAIVAKSSTDLGSIASDSRWSKPGDANLVTPWTDDYANFIGAMWRMYARGGLAADVN